jgi:hypothetical protein
MCVVVLMGPWLARLAPANSSADSSGTSEITNTHKTRPTIRGTPLSKISPILNVPLPRLVPHPA